MNKEVNGNRPTKFYFVVLLLYSLASQTETNISDIGNQFQWTHYNENSGSEIRNLTNELNKVKSGSVNKFSTNEIGSETDGDVNGRNTGGVVGGILGPTTASSVDKYYFMNRRSTFSVIRAKQRIVNNSIGTLLKEETLSIDPLKSAEDVLDLPSSKPLRQGKVSRKHKIRTNERKRRGKRHYSLRDEALNSLELKDGVDSPLSCLPHESKDDKVIDIAVLVPSSKHETFTPCSRDQVMPVVHLAVQHLLEQEFHGPLEGWNISVHYRDTNCSSTYGPLAAVDLHFQGKADVFLGPVCEYALAPVGRFASVWDTPVLTPGGHPHAFDFKENYPSLTRLRGFDTEVSRVFKSIADFFGWEVIGLLYEEAADSEGHSACHLTLSGVHDAFNKTSENRGFVQGVDTLQEVINYFSDKARIIVLCVQNSSIVREILLMAHDMGMTTGDFAFFNIQLFTTNQSNYRPWYNPKDSPKRNQEAKGAYSSLLTITARLPDDPAYANFTEEVHKIVKERFSFTSPDKDSYLSPYVVSFYEAVIVYSRALNMTLRANSSILNGTEIRNHLWNHTFTNLITGNVSINSNGDRNAGYSILDLDEDDAFGAFTVVGAYMGEQLNITKKIFWPGDGPPHDRPKCGFHGELCHSYLFLLVIGILCLLVVILLAFSVFIYRRLRRLTRGLDTLTTAVGEDDALQMVTLHKPK